MIKTIESLYSYCSDYGFAWNDSFVVEEFVPRYIYDDFGDSAIQFIDIRILKIVFELKEDLGISMTANNYVFGGRKHYRGFRPKSAEVKGSNPETSQHYKLPCTAIDLVFKGMTAYEVQKHILENKAKYMALGLTRIENAKHRSWLHIDVKQTGLDSIKVFNP